MIEAQKIANPELRKIKNEPGYYKWWAKEGDLKKLLSKFTPKITFNEIKKYLESENDYYCIYVGISKSSIRKRLNTHINGVILDSTLRKTIASILAYYNDENPEEKTNEFIDKLKLTYDYKDRNEVEEKETDLIKAKFHILNNSKNNTELAKKYKIKEQLTEFRKKAEEAKPLIFKKETKK